MKNNVLSCLVTSLLFSASLFAQNTAGDFREQWKQIDSLLWQKALPKSAQLKVNELYKKAYAQKNEAQVIKVLLYRLYINDQVTENDANNRIAVIQQEIKAAFSVPQKSILQVLLAKAYLNIYNNDKWRINSRKETKNDNNTDINQWTALKFGKVIDSLYNTALAPAPVLQQTTLSPYEAIIIKGNARYLQPTLYDLLARETLNYLTSNTRNITTYSRYIQNPNTLLPLESFINEPLSTTDSSTHQWQALRIYQQLLQFHRPDTNPAALIDLDLKRISWVYNNSEFEHKDSLYLQALKNDIARYGDEPTTAQAFYLVASFHTQKARNYQPLKDTTYRYYNLIAKNIIDKQLARQLPASDGSSNMQQLLQQITSPTLQTQIEKINIPGQPSRLYVAYKNIPVLYGRILRISTTNDSINNLNLNDSVKRNALLSTPAFRQFIQPLPVTNDYQQHATEVKIEALPPGRYMLITGTNSQFNNLYEPVAFQVFDVSAISYLQHNSNYFILNRETGAPIAGARININTSAWDSDSRTYKKSLVATYTADANGRFTHKSNNNNVQLKMTIFNQQDTLQVENDYFYSSQSYNNTDNAGKRNVQVHFFTDRSIYRPGQVIHFKGIAISSNQQSRHPAIYESKTPVQVILYNANGTAADSLTLTTNEYGSLTGQFTLPQNLLTGEFWIRPVSQNNSQTLFNGGKSVQVEEYKRPTFYVTIDTLQHSYRLHDTIVLTGHAKAYAGSAVNGGKVTFNVMRNTSFPYPWLFYKTAQPYSAPQTIINGTVNTDAAGNFTIRFPATPDEAIKASTQPVFTFTVETAVTNGSGETREAKTDIAAGYHSLVVALSVPAVVEKRSFTTIQANVKNLSGKLVPSAVQVTVYPLVSPERLTRERLWEAPDQFTMGYQEYISYFPHDEYGEENTRELWPRKKAVVTGSFTTSASIEPNSKAAYQLPALLPQGWYVIEAKVTDQNGDTLKDLSYVEVFDKQAQGLPSPQYSWNYTSKTSLLPGDTAELLSGSSADDVYVIRYTSRGTKRSGDYSYYKLDNNKKTTTLVANEQDKGGIALSYAFVRHNRLYSVSHSLQVPYPDKVLQVIYKTYRNKTQPGSQEQWSIQVSGEKGSKAAAELLTTMYDASLDQFKPHSWSAPVLWPSTTSGGYWNSGSNFTQLYSRAFPLSHKGATHLHLIYDQLADHLSPYLHGAYLSAGMENAPSFKKESAGMMVDAISLKRVDITGSVQSISQEFNVRVRGASDVGSNNNPLYVIDGVISPAPNISPDQISSLEILKGAAATALYGAQAANGVIVVTTKEGEKRQQPVQMRNNFNETAFFFPQLYADTSGNYTFSFTMPESLTQWKWLSLAHTKDLAFGTAQQVITTQKKLMAQLHTPRFVRQGDQLELIATISNLDTNDLTGKARLELIDAVTNQPIDKLLGNTNNSKLFFVKTGQSTPVQFPVQIPANYNNPITYRVVAQAGDYSDGEENNFPVLPNRALVTETASFVLKGNTSKHFTLEKLAHPQSSTLTTESVTVEYTTNPIWQAVQALPYLAEYPYECAEQTFNRFYANALAAFIVSKHPQVKAIFEQWRNDTAALQSNLQKNESLKQVLLQETPWVLQAENEAQQKKNIALLFDVVKMSTGTETALQQLKQMQLADGSFSWFKGGNADRYITTYIVTGIGKLMALNAIPAASKSQLQAIAENAIAYLDDRMNDDYKSWIENKINLKQDNLSVTGIQYLFARSYFNSLAFSDHAASQYLLQQAKQYWMKQNNYNKALLGVVLYRNNQQQVATRDILPSILENAIADSLKGMYWKDRTTCFWHPSPIEHQATIMLLAAELDKARPAKKTADAFNEMRTWLILNKQTTNWGTTIATADACYALLAKQDNLATDRKVTIRLGNTTISSDNETKTAGSGYLKHRIEGSQVTPATGTITVTTSAATDHTSSVSYGAVYWQYFEDMDKITVAPGNPLSLTKKWFIEKQTGNSTVLEALTPGSQLKVGDKVVVQIALKSDRDMDYVHVKDTRAASMEPVNVLSGYKWQDGLGYYEATKDASTNFFIDHLRKGTYVFNYPVYLTHTGTFTAGIAIAQCMYAPEFNSHSEGIKITVKAK